MNTQVTVVRRVGRDQLPPGYHLMFGSHLWATWRCQYWDKDDEDYGPCDTPTGKAFWVGDRVDKDSPAIRACRNHVNRAVATRFVLGGAPGIRLLWLSTERHDARNPKEQLP